MESPIKMTGQGIRDLNDRGPKKKPAAPIEAAVVAADEAPVAVVAPSTDEAPAPAVVPNG